MSRGPQQEIRQEQPFLRERRASAIGEAPTDLPGMAGLWSRPWTGFALSATMPGIVLALIGPFGSFSAPVWMRFAYWVPTMAAGAVLGAALTMSFERIAIFRTRPVSRAFAVATVMTGCMTLISSWGARAVFGAGSVPLSWTLVFYVWVITMVMVFVVGAARARRPMASAAEATPVATLVSDRIENGARPQNGSSPLRLSSRLSPGLKGATILALEAEDHYVRVHTAQGSELILIRLADAIADMGDVEGARTHRSWWVARAAVKEARRSDGRATLSLTNGAEAPVSRNALAELVEKGWL